MNKIKLPRYCQKCGQKLEIDIQGYSFDEYSGKKMADIRLACFRNKPFGDCNCNTCKEHVRYYFSIPESDYINFMMGNAQERRE